MFEMDQEQVREACRRWGFPLDGGENAGVEAVAAIKEADAALDILYPEQRVLLAHVETLDAVLDKAAPFIFGLMFQAMFAVVRDAGKGGGA